MTEFLIDRITNLKTMLRAAANGEAVALDMPDQDTPVDKRLKSLNAAIFGNIHQTVLNNHDQLRLALNFARHVLFFANRAGPESKFWADEIGNDREQNKFLFERAKQDINYTKVVKTEKAHQFLRNEFNLLDQHHIDEKTTYKNSVTPELSPAALEKIKEIRRMQMTLAREDAQRLSDRAEICVRRIVLVDKEIIPIFKKAADKAIAAWFLDIEATLKDGNTLLDHAEIMLLYHANRHSFFEDRLSRTLQNTPQP